MGARTGRIRPCSLPESRSAAPACYGGTTRTCELWAQVHSPIVVPVHPFILAVCNDLLVTWTNIMFTPCISRLEIGCGWKEFHFPADHAHTMHCHQPGGRNDCYSTLLNLDRAQHRCREALKDATIFIRDRDSGASLWSHTLTFCRKSFEGIPLQQVELLKALVVYNLLRRRNFGSRGNSER